ncbi:MAG: preprotein translocase subunit SecE [Thermoguttaceae bacterium]|jgi:preprotein translocase subunit SecE
MAGVIATGIKTLFSGKQYKPSLGKIARRSTFFGLAVLFLAGAWATYRENLYADLRTSAIVAGVFFLVGCWISFRVIHIPSFAEFLISVEAEMRKVSWPSRKELKQTTYVVLVVMALITLLVFSYDVIFSMVFRALDIILKSIGIG